MSNLDIGTCLKYLHIIGKLSAETANHIYEHSEYHGGGRKLLCAAINIQWSEKYEEGCEFSLIHMWFDILDIVMVDHINNMKHTWTLDQQISKVTKLETIENGKN